MWEMQNMSSNQSSGRRRHAADEPPTTHESAPNLPGLPATSEDLHAWSIYRQNLNSDFTDSALGSSEKSPMPYGNFHLREATMQSMHVVMISSRSAARQERFLSRSAHDRHISVIYYAASGI